MDATAWLNGSKVGDDEREQARKKVSYNVMTGSSLTGLPADLQTASMGLPPPEAGYDAASSLEMESLIYAEKMRENKRKAEENAELAKFRTASASKKPAVAAFVAANKEEKSAVMPVIIRSKRKVQNTKKEQKRTTEDKVNGSNNPPKRKDDPECHEKSRDAPALAGLVGYGDTSSEEDQEKD
jgi:hypothetical protein